MMLDENQFKSAIEEFKETGQEYRYRDQLMVQEFGLAMVAIAALLNVLLRSPAIPSFTLSVRQLFGLCFLALLSLHLRNINQDRISILKRRDELRVLLGFGQGHQNVSGGVRISAPKYFVRFVMLVSVAWATWMVFPWLSLTVLCQCAK